MIVQAHVIQNNGLINCEHCGLWHGPQVSCISYKTPVLHIPAMMCPECKDQLGWSYLDELRIVIRHSGGTIPMYGLGVDMASPNSWYGNVFATYDRQKRSANVIAAAPRSNKSVTGLGQPTWVTGWVTDIKERPTPQKIITCSRQDEELIRPIAQFTRYI